MKVLIVEDEKPVSALLQRFLQKIDPSVEVVAILESIADVVEWFSENPDPDLVFMDIQLKDGKSFEIFNSVLISCPIIFTTGFDEYALQAFKVNSIDYLMKPINPLELENALKKYHRLTSSQSESIKSNMNGFIGQLENVMPARYKNRFLVKSGQKLIAVPVAEIAYFYTENKLVFLFTKEGKRHIVEHTLDEVNEFVDPLLFYRINRQFIVGIDSIAAIHSYFNNRLKLDLSPKPMNLEDVIVSSKKVTEFKQWLDQ